MTTDRSYHVEHLNQCQNLAKSNGFGGVWGKLLLDPYYLLNVGHVLRPIENPHITSMQDTPRNIYIKFGSNWPSSVREDLKKKITLKIEKTNIEKGQQLKHGLTD